MLFKQYFAKNYSSNFRMSERKSFSVIIYSSKMQTWCKYGGKNGSFSLKPVTNACQRPINLKKAFHFALWGRYARKLMKIRILRGVPQAKYQNTEILLCIN